MRKDRLLRYCKDKGIVVPRGATVSYLCLAIVRATLHENPVPKILKVKDTCFGYWENENPECLTCDHQECCFEASIGMPKPEFDRKLATLDNPRIKFTERLSRSPLR